MSCYIIAEIGPNHNGDLAIARDMVKQLAGTGVDAVKFQLAVPENVYSQDAFKADYQTEFDGAGSPLEMSRRIQLPQSAHEVLYEDCRSAGLDYLCTAFDLESLKFLDRNFDLKYFKVASGEIISLDTLRYIGERERPVLLSTGMASLDEISECLALLDATGPKAVTILHCVSNYPAPAASINLLTMDLLAETFSRPVGYSDHSLGPEACLAAVARGAQVIEKHVTSDQTMAGPDHKASATIEEMATLVKSVRAVEAILGQKEKIFSNAENGIRNMARKSIVAERRIEAGAIIAAEDLCFKRPGTGLSPMTLERIIGRKARWKIEADRVIMADWLE